MKCSFCGSEIPRGTGKIFVRADSKIFYFHSRKCEKNALKLKRTARHVKWTKHFEKGTIVKSKKEKA